MTTLVLLKEMRDSLRAGRAPDRWMSTLASIEADHQFVLDEVSSGRRIYGLTTLPGHRDDSAPDPGEQPDRILSLLGGHRVGGPPFLPEESARYVGYTKLYTLASGFSGVSPALYKALTKTIPDPNFRPLIPAEDSYSSGDVIPASHWALDAINFAGVQPSDADAMAMMNGAFVHIGRAASLVDRIGAAFSLFVETTVVRLAVADCDASNLWALTTAERDWMRSVVDYIHLRSGVVARTDSPQDSVSIRATPDVLEALCATSEDFLTEINYRLGKPSANPIFDRRSRAVLSQGGFLSSLLTVRSSALAESLLSIIWIVSSRSAYLLSGRVARVSIDASTSEADFGQIQLPKMISARAERSRLRHSRKAFAAGGATSHGVEDYWTLGVLSASDLEELLKDVIEVLSLELELLSRVLSVGQGAGTAGGLLQVFSDFDGPFRYADFVVESGDAPGCEEARALFPV